MVLKLFQRSFKTVQTRFTTTIKIHENLASKSSQYSDKTVEVSQNVFAGSKVKSLKNPWRSSQHSVSVGSIANPSKLSGFQRKCK